MGPEPSNNNSGKSPYAFSNFKANNNFKQTWCCYHDADDMHVLCNIYDNVDKSILRSILSSWWKRKRGATTTTTGMVPRHIQMIRQFVERPVQKNKSAEYARVMGSDPGFRVSHELATRERVTIWTRCKHEHLKHHKHSFTDVVSGLYLRSVQTGRFSSSSVVVHDRRGK